MNQCASFFGQEKEEEGLACMLEKENKKCNACLMIAATQDVDGVPDCYAKDCGDDTLPCFFNSELTHMSDESAEATVIECVKDNGSSKCKKCVGDYEDEKSGKKGDSSDGSGDGSGSGDKPGKNGVATLSTVA